jgi:hypothetical protein
VTIVAQQEEDWLVHRVRAARKEVENWVGWKRDAVRREVNRPARVEARPARQREENRSIDDRRRERLPTEL